MVVEYGDYKGNRWIRLKSNEQDIYPFQFGIEKAKKIVQHYEEVKAFAESKKGCVIDGFVCRVC